MDGATSELRAAGYGRSAELRASGEQFGKWYAWRLGDCLRAYRMPRVTLEHLDAQLRGLPAHAHDWPQWCFERFAESNEANEFSETDLLAMRDPFIAECALRLDDAGYDCR